MGLQAGPELGQRFCFVAKTLQEVRVFRGSPNVSFLILVFYSFPFNMLLLRNLTKTWIQPNLKFSNPEHQIGYFILGYVSPAVATNIFDTDTESLQFSYSVLSQELKTWILSFSVAKLSNITRSTSLPFLPHNPVFPTHSISMAPCLFKNLVFNSHFILEDNLSNSFTCAINHQSSQFCTMSSVPSNPTSINNRFTNFYFLDGLLVSLAPNTILVRILNCKH